MTPSICCGYNLDLPEYWGCRIPTYVILPRTAGGFDVKIVGDDGARQTMLGFPTRVAAQAWILEDQRRSREEMQHSCTPALLKRECVDPPGEFISLPVGVPELLRVAMRLLGG
jgi:hypothetical protein